MQPSDLDQFIEEAKYGKRLYLYFTGAIVLSGVVLASASFLLPLPDKAAIPELTKLGGGFIACLSAFPIKEFLAKRERVVALTAIRQRISLASTQQIQSNELTKLVEIYWKIYEKGATGG